MRAFAAVSFFGLIPVTLLFAASDTQTITLDHKLQIPGATLKRGDYTFEIEDRLQDRAIIRITDAKKQSHDLVLAVPNEKLNQGEHGKLILFPTADTDKQILEGWMCPSCETALEVVYPKAEAAKITSVSAKPVLAVDPTYDKLPKNLTPDDMKVVTLWLLSPKEVTADQKGKGLEAAKWADVSAPKKTEVAEARSTPAPADHASSPEPAAPAASSAPSAPEAPSPAPAATPAPTSATATPADEAAAPASSPASSAPASSAPASSAPAMTTPAMTAPGSATRPIETASAEPRPVSGRRMPHTASSTFTFGLIGLMLLGAGTTLRLQRRLSESKRSS